MRFFVAFDTVYNQELVWSVAFCRRFFGSVLAICWRLFNARCLMLWRLQQSYGRLNPGAEVVQRCSGLGCALSSHVVPGCFRCSVGVALWVLF